MIACPNCKNELNNNYGCNNCKDGPKVDNGIVVFHPDMDDNCQDYDSSGLNSLHQVENSHFWFVQRKKVIKCIFDKYVLKNNINSLT